MDNMSKDILAIIPADSLKPEIFHKIKKSQISCNEWFLSPLAQLSKATDLNNSDIDTIRKLLYNRISKSCYIGRVSEIVELNSKLSSGSIGLDSLLDGGFIYPSLIEIAGESGTGKTQLCLQLSIQAQMPRSAGGIGEDRSVAYISTEHSFPSFRLKQMIENRIPEINKALPGQSNLFYKLSSKIFLERTDTTSGLEHYLTRWVPKLVEEKNLGLLIIDSIAGVLRGEFDHEDGDLKNKAQWKICKLLRDVSFKNNIPVILINQVTGNVQNPIYYNNHAHSVGNLYHLLNVRENKASLGATWSNMINERYIMHKTNIISPLATNNTSILQVSESMRAFSIDLSSHLPPSSVYYQIEQSGIVVL